MEFKKGLNMKNNKDLGYALVTGGAKGIGRALSEELAKNRFNLLLIGRDQVALDTAKDEIKLKGYHIDIQTLSLDLTNIESYSKIFEFVKENNISLKLVVNNAGASKLERSSELKIEGIYQETLLDLIAPVSLMIKYVEYLKTNNLVGEVININSLVVRSKSHPVLSLYRSLKIGLDDLSKELDKDLRENGYINLDIYNTYLGAITGTGIATAKVADKSPGKLTTNEVAKIIVKEYMSGNKVIVPGFINKLAYFSSPLVPDFIARNSLRKLYKD